MIDLKHLTSEARGVLNDAIPHYTKENFYEDPAYIELYKKFLKATGRIKNPPTFNEFNVAVCRFKRVSPLTYKDETNDVETKSVSQINTRKEYRAHIRGQIFKVKCEALGL